MSQNKKKILLIDGLNMFFRAYAANPSMNINGQHIGAITGFFYSLQKSIKDTRPHQIIVIWDGKGGSKKRQEIRTDYKHGRKVPKPLKLNRALDIERTPEEENQSRLYQQNKIIELLNYLPILQLCEVGVEADDFISYFCSYFSCENDFLKIIVSNDKDFMQLTNKCTILYRPAKQEFITYKHVIEEHNIHPQNMALARAIAGDTADNLSGVPRVGLKTLSKLFPEFKENHQISFEELKILCEKHLLVEKPNKKNRESLPPDKAILTHFETIEQNYKIMQLYMPMVPVETKLRVDEQISEFIPQLFMDQFFSDLKKEGIFGASFTEIIKHSQAMIKEYKK